MSRYEVQIEKKHKIIMNHCEYDNFCEFQEQIQQLCGNCDGCENCPLGSFGLGNAEVCTELFALINTEVIYIE